ncbi:MAG: transglutaminase domain-containing protein [Bradymonadia bacterium]
MNAVSLPGRRIVAPLLLALALFGCGGAARNAPVGLRVGAAAPADLDGLQRALAAWYSARVLDALRSAVGAALAAAPEDARALDLAASLALLEDRRFDRFDVLERALRQPENPLAQLHLRMIDELAWTAAEMQRARALFEDLRAGHPDPDIRGLAALLQADLEHALGQDAARDAALAETGVGMPWSVIGTFDNDQGKGLDLEYPPERGLDPAPTATVRGKLVDVAWRTDAVRDPRGRFDLAGLLDPVQWQVAYLATGLRVAQEGEYELRIGTSDPIKVWVNDVPVLRLPTVADWAEDALIVPVRLRAGVNRVLVKSAHGEGPWLFAARVTRRGGALPGPGEVSPVPPHTPFAPGPPPVAEPLGPAQILAGRVASAKVEGPAAAYQAFTWAKLIGFRVEAVEAAERLGAQMPDALVTRAALVSATWDNQERARTADLLQALVEQAGDALPWLKLQQARFWGQQGLGEKARARLVELTRAHPDRPTAWLRLAELFEREGWNEDRLRVLRDVDARWPRWGAVRLDLADALEDLRFYPESAAVLEGWLEIVPNDVTALQGLHWHAQGNDDFKRAEVLARHLSVHWPHLRSSWERLAETQRRAGRIADAEATLRRLIALCPTASIGWVRLAELSYQEGRTDLALDAWRNALERDPDNERLANRLDFLAPSAAGPWVEDVPDERALDAAVARARSTPPLPGADVVYLLDDEVSALRSDGSTVNFISTVAYAVNDAGRDRLTRLSVRSDGRARVLHAFSVDAAGNRTDASTIRGSNVRFRQLQAGSIVVLQYRLDSPPDGYLASHMARQWWFDTPGGQVLRSRWVLWRPRSSMLHESAVGTPARDERTVGDLVRVSWQRDELPPFMLEPGMPTLHESASNLVVSTVPSWDTFLEWEESLLQEAFRVGPEVQAVADTLFAGATTALDKVERIQAWLMNEIRYQQDYEKFIAGVKPHAAPVTVSRRYGDCKDKAVLFITLARLAGLDAHFALIRTRDAGPVVRGAPMQQFNHAIVYVPAQPGLPEGRFYDPTVELLDVDVLRHDDQGTVSLVIDPRPFLPGAQPGAPEHQWRPVPYQPAETDRSTVRTRLTLDARGDATGEVAMEARGRIGSTLRRSARNAEQLAQLMQQQVGATLPGARIGEPKPGELASVRVPATLSVPVTAPSVGRVEGDDLRVKVPVGWSPAGWFSLAERRHDVLLGTPRSMRWSVTLTLPEGARLVRLPTSGEVKSECLHFSRSATSRGQDVLVEQRVDVLCERISAGDYAAERLRADEIQRVLDAEIVARLPRRR